MAQNSNSINPQADQMVELAIEQFKLAYPNCHYTNLIPTKPKKMENVNISQKEMAQIQLNSVLLSVLCGTTFGDATLNIPAKYKNARLQYRHSTRQTEWFMWKSLCIFGDFTTEQNLKKGICFQNPDGKQAASLPRAGELLGKWKFQSTADERLTAVCNILCPNNKKKLQRFWLNHMNNYFLMTLWLDDGSLLNGRQGVISCNSTPKDQAEILADYITKVWDVECDIHLVPSKRTKTNQEPYQLTIHNFENLEKLIRIIAPIVPVKEMLYKVCLYKNDASFLQRWIPYLKSVVPTDWHDSIDSLYMEKSLEKNGPIEF
jgi:hypothetical protein